MEKFVFCCPRGGWNDILCQVALCIKYAESKNRALIIDTTVYSGISDSLENYFTLKEGNPRIFLSPSPELSALLKSDNNFTNFYNKYFKEIVRIDFSRDYDDRILVHSAAGGGSSSRECFNFFKLSNAVSAYIKIKIEEIGSPYHAVMIRNTDYKTDYISLFETIKKDLGSNTLLISSDDLECVNFGRAYFFRNKVVNFSNLPSHNSGKPLLLGHYKHSIDQKILNLDALTDLFLSASANKLYPSYIKSLNGEHLKPGMQSGFQKLAIYLHENRALLNSVTNLN